MKNFLFSLLIVFSTGILYSQNENNNWYFGTNAGITFNTSPPSGITGGMVNTEEGCASISNSNGNLLFYTDGRTVYDRTHAIMQNGTGLYGGWSTTQSALLVPLPNSIRYYYMFTLDEFAGPNGFCYSIVDMNANGGLGAITTKNVSILTPTAEKVVAVKQTNNLDFWIIVHGWDNNTFYSYKLTSAGFVNTPVTSSVGSVHTGGGGQNNASNAIGQMKVSPDRSKIALAVAQDMYNELYNFDVNTGILSNCITIPEPDGLSTSRTYGVEFSPNSRYLYLKSVYSGNVYQYDVSIYNSATIINSKRLIGSVTGEAIYVTGALQMGPDNKIYIAKYYRPYLGVINFPDNPAATTGLQDNAISLSGNNCRIGLPCLVQHTFFNSLSINYSGCYFGPYSFGINSNGNIASYNWNINDMSSPANTSTDSVPFHTFTHSGIYHVQLICTNDNGFTDTAYVDVTASAPPDVISEDTIYICNGQQAVIHTSGPYDTYSWSNGVQTPSITVNGAGYYSVTVTGALCSVTDSVLVILSEGFDLNIGNDTSLCPGNAMVLHAETPGATYAWQNGSHLSYLPVSSPGTYWVEVNVNSCIARDTINVAYTDILFYLGEDKNICGREDIILNHTGSYDSVLWNTGILADSIIVTEPGTYYATVYIHGCSATDTIKVNSCSEIWFPNAFSPNGDRYNDSFLPKGVNVEDFTMMIFNRWGSLLYETTDISKGWDGTYHGNKCPQGVYFYISHYSLWENGQRSNKGNQGSVTLVR